MPPGYRFEPTADDVGVLAPSQAFAPGPFDISALEDDALALKQGYSKTRPRRSSA